METTTANVSNIQDPPPSKNPHVLWRQVLGFILWVGPLSLVVAGPIGAALCLALGGVTFADAWKSGIYKIPGRKAFLNISPMAWGIAMAFLFVATYPAYLLNRNRLRTIQGSDAFYWATIVLGVVAIALSVVSVLTVPDAVAA